MTTDNETPVPLDPDEVPVEEAVSPAVTAEEQAAIEAAHAEQRARVPKEMRRFIPTHPVLPPAHSHKETS